MSLNMANISNEVVQKLRSQIKEELNRIGAFVDNELPDYIMVMVANQKSRYQMKDDLSLFLGKDTDDFVNWLHDQLKSFQVKVNGDENKKSKKDSKKDDSRDDKSKSYKKSEMKEESKNVNDLQDDKLKSSNKDNVKEHESTAKKIKSKSDDLKSEVDNKKTEQDGLILDLKSEADEGDELLQETDEFSTKKSSDTKSNLDNQTKKRASVKAPISTIGAVLKNSVPEDDDEDVYDPSKPVVASVIKVKERKSSIPTELQANKILVMKAVKDAQKSLNTNKRKLDDEIEYKPTPIKKRLGEKRIDLLEKDDLRNYLNSTKNAISEENMESEDLLKENEHDTAVDNIDSSPRFVVTLDGVNHEEFMKNHDDEILITEEMDEEFLENDDCLLEDDPPKINERCKYWPACKNGDKCEYHHPVTTCKSFPNCRFGDKCLFIHPNCKYDALCTRTDCPFTHASKRLISNQPSFITPIAMAALQHKQCRFYPNCKNPACPYFHPAKNCHYGANCRTPMCPFTHPVTKPKLPTIPPLSKMKWNVKDHISERKFSLNEEASEKENETKVEGS